MHVTSVIHRCLFLAPCVGLSDCVCGGQIRLGSRRSHLLLLYECQLSASSRKRTHTQVYHHCITATFATSGDVFVVLFVTTCASATTALHKPPDQQSRGPSSDIIASKAASKRATTTSEARYKTQTQRDCAPTAPPSSVWGPSGWPEDRSI